MWAATLSSVHMTLSAVNMIDHYMTEFPIVFIMAHGQFLFVCLRAIIVCCVGAASVHSQPPLSHLINTLTN